jgi:20S proteasome subunit beta 7
LEKKGGVPLTKEEAMAEMEKCLKVLYYRDARSLNRVSGRGRICPALPLVPLLSALCFSTLSHVCFRRQYEIAIISAEGVEIQAPRAMSTDWSIASMVQ